MTALLDGPEGARVRIQTRAPDGRVREHVLTRSRAHVAEAHAGSGITHEQRRLAEPIASLAAAAVNIVAAAMLFRRRERERREARAETRAFDSERRIAAIEAALAKLTGSEPRSEPC
jgi:hypothetical protein